MSQQGYHFSLLSLAPGIGFDPESYLYDENAGVVRLTVITNMPARFTDVIGALFYTEDGSATGGGGVQTILARCVPAP